MRTDTELRLKVSLVSPGVESNLSAPLSNAVLNGRQQGKDTSPQIHLHIHTHTSHPPSPAYLMPGCMDPLLLAGIAQSQDTDLALARTTSPVSGRMRVFVAADSIQDLHLAEVVGVV